MRYTKEFKLECIRKRANGECIPDPPGCSHSAFRHTVMHWTKIYNKLGEAGLEHNKPKLSIDEKLKCIQRVIDGESFHSIAESIGRQVDQISRWYSIYLHEGIEGLKSKTKGRPPKMKKEEKDIDSLSLEEQNKELKKRLELLEIENEYLKKLAALVQQRKGQQRKKR